MSSQDIDTQRLVEEVAKSGTQTVRGVQGAFDKIVQNDPNAYTEKSGPEVQRLGKERSEGPCAQYIEDFTFKPFIKLKEISRISAAKPGEMPNLEALEEVARNVKADGGETLFDVMRDSFKDYIDMDGASLAETSSDILISTLRTIVQALDTRNIDVVENREIEFDSRTEEYVQSDEIKKIHEQNEDLISAMQVEKKAQVQGVDCLNNMVDDADVLRKNIGNNETQFTSGVDNPINDALAINAEGEAKWTAFRERLESDLKGMKINNTNIEAAITELSDKMNLKQTAYKKKSGELEDRIQAILHEMYGGLMASLAAELQRLRAHVENENEYKISVEVHKKCSATLFSLKENGADLITKYRLAKGNVNTIISVHQKIGAFLERVRDIAKAEYSHRLNGPVPADEVIIANRKYESTLLQKANKLCYVLLPRANRKVQAKADAVKIRNMELEKVRTQYRVAYKLMDEEKMKVHEKRMEEIKEEIVSAEAALAEEQKVFDQFVIDTRYEEIRKRLVDEYGATAETLGPSAIQAVADMPPSGLTIDLQAMDGSSSFLTYVRL